MSTRRRERKKEGKEILHCAHDESPTKKLSSYFCKYLHKRQNSQILRRPQDDNDGG
jgi:hypothetical protein